MPMPVEIVLHRRSAELELRFDDGLHARLPAALLRRRSPSAETRHAPAPADEAVAIEALEPVGQYALRLIFSDGHQTGLYTWDLLYQLARERPEADRQDREDCA